MSDLAIFKQNASVSITHGPEKRNSRLGLLSDLNRAFGVMWCNLFRRGPYQSPFITPKTPALPSECPYDGMAAWRHGGMAANCNIQAGSVEGFLKLPRLSMGSRTKNCSSIVNDIANTQYR
ncbi:MAG: hypothetical protein ACJ06V_07720 [Verrucomicrobiota bacterium]